MAERAQSEEEKERSEAVSGNRSLAHALNNILMPIIMNAEMVMESLPPDHPSRPLVEKILRSAHRGKDLIV